MSRLVGEQTTSHPAEETKEKQIMNLKEEAAKLWRICTILRNQLNWKDIEEQVERLDHLAMNLALLAGSDYTEICKEFELE